MNKKYIVRLADEERAICEATIKKEKGRSEKLRRATILLKSDTVGQRREGLFASKTGVLFLWGIDKTSQIPDSH